MAPADEVVTVEASHAVRAALARIGRTEDLRFSPNGSRLAVARFADDLIAVIDVKVAAVDGHLAVSLGDVIEVGSAALSAPHGIDFIDEDTLVVANRTGGVAVLRIDDAGATTHLVNELAGGGVHEGVRSPGSIAVTAAGGETLVIVCDNDDHVVTSHRVTRDSTGVSLAAGEVLVRRGLDIPDGVALSADGRWLAISNHHTNSVMVYDTSAGLGAEVDPACVLRGVRYPHGLRFVDGSRVLLVADAGSPHVLAFRSGRDGWGGVRYPAASLQVIDTEAFAAGQRNPEEGGPKGIDVDPDEQVMAVTSETLPLAFVPLAPLLEAADGSGSDDTPLRRLHVDYEMHVVDRNHRIKTERTDAIERAGRAEHLVGIGQIEIDDLHSRLARIEAAHEHEQRRADSNQLWAEAERARAESAEAHLTALRSTKLFRSTAALRAAYAWLRRG